MSKECYPRYFDSWDYYQLVNLCLCPTHEVYDELDEDLQQSFESYLRERGVDEKLGEYIMAAVNDKEQREYVAWMGRVREFLNR